MCFALLDSSVACSYYLDGTQSTLDLFRDTGEQINCWVNSHTLTGTLGLVLLCLYVLSTVTYGMSYQESVDPNDDVLWRGSFILLERTFKTFILIPNVFFAQNVTLMMVFLLIQTACFAILAWILAAKDREGNMVCSIHVLAYLKAIMYTLCSWASLMTFCASLLDEPESSGYRLYAFQLDGW